MFKEIMRLFWLFFLHLIVFLILITSYSYAEDKVFTCKPVMARDAFMREFEIDLNDGNIVAYKGTVFEIIEANNATITYKVVRHFKN